MQKCPNCGQPTARTEDWACQWCGYPLLSKSYRKIPKTYRQLQEERRKSLVREPVLENESALEAEPITELEPESIAELEGEPILEDETAFATEPKPIPRPKRKRKRKREPASEVEPEPASEPEDEPILEPETVPEPEQESIAEIEPALEPETEITAGAIEITVGELRSEYKTDKVAADAKFVDKILRVTGIVDKMVVRENLDIRYVLLTSAEEKGTLNVRCTFDREHISGIRRLTSGQAITIQGKYDGYQRNILMTDCSVVG